MFRPISLIRVFFVALVTACGYWITRGTEDGSNSAILAFILALLVVLFEYSLRTVSIKHLILGAVGLLFGLIVSVLVYLTIPETVLTSDKSRIACNLLFGYLGLIIALKHTDKINLNSLRFMVSNPESAQTQILDTSVIIDGRVEDLIVSGYLSGPIICPSFVIDELQALADSADSLKRGKGRRGLTILKSIQDQSNMQILEKNYPDIREVDRQLIELGKEINGVVVTNDYNLQKVADLHKVHILNINELADILKPTVFVGESFSLTIMREGKEHNQGVGYLPDGTMVVIDDGVSFINKEISIVVTSILQTNTGRMVFGRPVYEGNANASKAR